MWTDVAAAPAAIHVGMVDAGEEMESREGDVVGRGEKVVLGATVEKAVVDKGYDKVVEGTELELEDGAGVEEEMGLGGTGRDDVGRGGTEVLGTTVDKAVVDKG